MSNTAIREIIDELYINEYFDFILDPKIALATGIYTKVDDMPFMNMNGSTELTSVWYPTDYPGGMWSFIQDQEVNLYNTEDFIPSYTNNLNASIGIFNALGVGFHYSMYYKYVVNEKDCVVFIAETLSDRPFARREWRGEADKIEVAFLIAALKAWLWVKHGEVY